MEVAVQALRPLRTRPSKTVMCEDAPVEKVFEHAKDPQKQFDACAGNGFWCSAAVGLAHGAGGHHRDMETSPLLQRIPEARERLTERVEIVREILEHRPEVPESDIHELVSTAAELPSLVRELENEVRVCRDTLDRQQRESTDRFSDLARQLAQMSAQRDRAERELVGAQIRIKALEDALKALTAIQQPPVSGSPDRT